MNQLPHNRTVNPKTLIPDPRTVVVLDQDIVTFRRLSTGTRQAFFHFPRARKLSEGGDQVYESANISALQIVHSKRNCNGSVDPMITLDRSFIQILGPNFGFWLLGSSDRES